MLENEPKKIHQTVSCWIKEKNPGWSLLHSTLDSLVDRLIGLCVFGVGTPDNAQKVLLHRLGLTPPQRLRTLDQVQQM
jgi:hypothetical protein